ncbi:hypothetical protein Nepgr_003544 [Nepenthes gracilis]|uniref:Uncharacterized protein n=1 Tax=Nepenthes gracilis TaxID=150966 RepID=A0AAD3RZR3_NEPGR|nr:hypothetical protein Nepgr_003544 [Nepenthes gracilis]
MEETSLKRIREEAHIDDDVLKRQKSFKDIISILEEEEEEPNQDLSSLMTTLQQELSSASDNCGSSSSSDFPFIDQAALLSSSSSEADPSDEIFNPSTVEYCSLSPSAQIREEDDERDRVMRHLLEASDDELGIPNIEGRSAEDGKGVVVGEIDGGDLLHLDDGLWELEDEAANYYTLLQSELFM